MSVKNTNRLLMSTAWLALAAISATPALAQQVAAADQAVAASDRTGNVETVVVTGTAFNTDVAPAKASLDTMEPQTIINKSYIADSVANTADYTTILAIAPSMTGQDVNGPGLSDGNVKNTLRGLPDGDFVLAYDGIPFGDTNGPTHHSESYFPGVTIGSIDVDRGPGNAGSLGAATFGGSVNMFSEVLNPVGSIKTQATYGSWNTQMLNGNYQSGDFEVAGFNNRVLINANYTGSDGYLTLQNTARQNFLIKIQTDIAPGWTLTTFANYNGLFQHVNDKNGATPAQITAFGENFALQNTNPKLATYQAYNVEGKKTDMDYARLEGAVGGISLDDTFYTYAYVNKTISATDVQQTAANIASGITQGNGTIVGGVKFPNDVPGYTKQNAYRVWGNILRLSDDFNFGWLTGELRAGLWWESSATQRQRFDFDLTQCFANTCNPWHNETYADSTLVASTKAAPLFGGFSEYVEHSNWSQYEPFAELELHPVDGLTITPGVKYVDWDRDVNAVLEQKTVPVVPYAGSFTTTRTLPFLMANYKIEENWSVYAQYAQGIYVPDISAFEQKTPLLAPPQAETTTNYQLGSVYYADNFTFDGDLYYIGVNNNIVFEACNVAPFTGPASETCALNTGTAVYKGIEGEGTYAMGNGLSLFASFSINDSKTAGKYVLQAPLWTEATGIVWKMDALQFSIIDKLVGQQYSDTANTAFYRLGAYNNMDFKSSWTIGNLQLGAGINNLLNERNLLSVGINDKSPIGGSSVYDIANRGSSLDQYYFAPARSYQISLSARF